MAIGTGNYDITLLKSGSKVGDGYLLRAETYETKDDRFGRSQDSRKLIIEVNLSIKLREP